MATGHSHHVAGEGSIMINYQGANQETRSVLHTPNDEENLLSVGMKTYQECIVIFSSDECWIMREESTLTVLGEDVRDQRSGLYKLMASKEAVSDVDMLKALDMKLRHINLQVLTHVVSMHHDGCNKTK